MMMECQRRSSLWQRNRATMTNVYDWYGAVTVAVVNRPLEYTMYLNCVIRCYSVYTYNSTV